MSTKRYCDNCEKEIGEDYFRTIQEFKEVHNGIFKRSNVIELDICMDCGKEQKMDIILDVEGDK